MEPEIGLKWGFSNLIKKTNEWYFSKDHILFIRSKEEHFQNYENVFYFFLKVLLVLRYSDFKICTVLNFMMSANAILQNMYKRYRNIIYIMKIWYCGILHIDIITKEIFLSKDKKNAAVPCPFIFKGDLHDKIAKLQWLTSIDSPLNLVKSPAAKICWHVSKLWRQNKSFDCKKIHCFCSLAKFIWLIPLFD